MDQENGKEVKLDSGASLYISTAPWREAKALQDALARALNGTGVSASEVNAILKLVQMRAGVTPREENPEEAAVEKLSIVAALTRKALELASNTELERAIFACAEKAFYCYDGTKATALQFKLSAPGYNVFDHQACRDQARGDFYDICQAIVEENLRPFGKALFSAFMAHAEKSAATRESSTSGSETQK